MISDPAVAAAATTLAPEAHRPVRPMLAFRVGVTGARNIPADALAGLRERIDSVLATVREEVVEAGKRPEVARAYEIAGDGSTGPLLRLLSPLAVGADRMAADAATALGYRLDVATPFPRAEYETDFPKSPLDPWLGSAGAPDEKPYFALDGAHGDDANRSYEAVGRLVVRNCDLLLALWDGKDAKGRGGTAEIVRFSARFGPPVWWIDVSLGREPRLIRSIADIRWPDDAPAGETAEAELRKLVRAAIEPPHGHAHPHGLIATAMDRLGKRNAFAADPLESYLAEKPLPSRLIWKAHRLIFRTPAPPTESADTTRPAPELAAVSDYWERIHQPADRASIDYRDRYRSSYVWVFLLAAVAAACAITALASKELKPFASWAEFAALIAILALVAVNQSRGWHGRWIAYRLLAELARKQEALATLGWSLPSASLRRFGGSSAAEPWVGWYFNAALRAAPLPSGTLTPQRVEATRATILTKLISGQARYHKARKQVNAAAGRWLVIAGEALFLITVGVVCAKLALIAASDWTSAVNLLGVLAALAPAASAAFLGVRSYSEVALLEKQSARMETIMADAEKRIGAMRLDRPLASQDLATEVFDVSSEMLQDVGGWADMFRLKAVEAG